MLNIDDLLRSAPPERATSLLSANENQWFDRKSGRIKAVDLAAALVGFANAEGGTIAVGLHSGKLDPAPVTAYNDYRQAAMDFTYPTAPVAMHEIGVEFEGQEATVLLFVVQASTSVHATHRDDVFLRVGDETRRLTYDQRRELEFDKGQSNFEAGPARIATWRDLDESLLANLARDLGASSGHRLLQARGLAASQDRPSVGAVLLFGQNPQAELPEAHLRVVRHQGVDRSTGRRQQILHDQRVEGTLPQQIDHARELVNELVPRRRALGREGRFVDVGAIPEDAWLEGIVNAVAHRSYSVAGDHTRIEIFDDRLEITSPGRFPGLVDLTDPTRIDRFARNPRIARVLSDLRFGQELGEGIRRMFDEMQLAGLGQPEYTQGSASVRLSLLAEPVDLALEARLADDARALVRAIRDAGRLSTGELTRLSGRSRPAVLSTMRALREAGVVEWVGKSPKDPRAYWRLAKS